jgi:hypothetical protein
LFFYVCGLLLAPGFGAGFIVGSEDSSAAQIFVGVNVLSFLRLFAGAFLTGGFGNILRSPGATLRGAGKETGAKKDGESAAKRPAERNPRVYLWLGRTGEVSSSHFPTGC